MIGSAAFPERGGGAWRPGLQTLLEADCSGELGGASRGLRVASVVFQGLRVWDADRSIGRGRCRSMDRRAWRLLIGAARRELCQDRRWRHEADRSSGLLCERGLGLALALFVTCGDQTKFL